MQGENGLETRGRQLPPRLWRFVTAATETDRVKGREARTGPDARPRARPKGARSLGGITTKYLFSRTRL